MTYVIAIHEIQDPEKFWGGNLDLPEGVSLHGIYPRADGARAVCVWEGDSDDQVREIVESAAGEISRNEFFEVDASHPATTGLPASARTPA